jgi:hypothetical protein
MGKAGGVWMELLHGTRSWEPLVMVFFTVQGPKAQIFYILFTQLYVHANISKHTWFAKQMYFIYIHMYTVKKP